MGNGIEIMVAVDQASQTLLDYVEERVERSKGRYLGSLIIYSKLVDVPCDVLPSFVPLRNRVAAC